MADNPYFVLHLDKASDLLEEWLTEHAFTYGALGISEPLNFSQPEGDEAVITLASPQHQLEVYFQEPPSPEFLQLLRERFPEATPTIKQEANRDWLAEWKKGFHPFPLAGGHWIVPSWCEPPPEAQHKIWIDPGMAFGTGTHETTQLVAEEYLELATQLKPTSVLDVGTGTGVLAILASQLGAQKIMATEIDQEARRVAQENWQRNHCHNITLRENEDLSRETFEIVMANIIDGVLLRMQGDLLARVRPGGWLIVSGIISEREQVFLNGFQLPQNKTWDHRRAKGDWRLFAARIL